MTSPSRATVLKLFKGLLQQANKFGNYNFKNHAIRRIKYEFQINKNIPNEQINEKYCVGKHELESLKRQTLLTQMYPEDISVMQSSELKRKL